MSELVIRGLTLDQYAMYSAEANHLRQKWEQSGGTMEIQQEMLQILAKYGQDPRTCCDEDGLNYHYCGNIPEWLDVINKDAEMLVRYSQVSGSFIQQQMFGSADASAGQAIEGVTLEKYAETCAKLQHAAEADVPGIVASLGYADINHWGRVRDGFNSAMEQDTSLKLSTHFGQLFARYAPQHMAASHQHTVDLVAEHIEECEDRDALQEEAVKVCMKMAAGGQANQMVAYLKQTFPDDADDNDALDWYLDKACDLFGEAGNRAAATAVLQVRYGLQDDEDDPMEVWVNDQLNILFC